MVITGATEAVPVEATRLSSASGGCNGYVTMFLSSLRGISSFLYTHRNEPTPTAIDAIMSAADRHCASHVPSHIPSSIDTTNESRKERANATLASIVPTITEGKTLWETQLDE